MYLRITHFLHEKLLAEIFISEYRYCNLLLPAELLLPFGVWTELAIPGYRVQAISSNYSATTVVTVATSSPSSLPLLPFAGKATPILTLF